MTITQPAAPPSESRAPLPRNVKLLGAASLLNDIASEMVYPLMPQFLIGVLGGNRFQLGAIEGVAESLSSLLKLWFGARSDRIGRRKSYVVAGYALTSVARPLLIWATAPWHLFAVRIADRTGKGIRSAPRDAMIADSCPPTQRGQAFGFNRAMDHLGAAIGPVLATVFLLAWPDQLRMLFLFTLVPGLIVVVLIVWGLNESARSQDELERLSNHYGDEVEIRRHGSAILPWNFRMYLLALVVFTLGNSSDAFLLVRAGELGVPTALLPLLWCVFHIVKSSGNFLAGYAVDRIGPRPLIFAGWSIYAVIYLAFACATAAWEIWVLFLAYGLFFALTEPAEKTLVTQLVGPERKGLAFGWFNLAIGISALPSSLIFGWIYQRFGALPAFGWGAGLAALAALLLGGVRGGGGDVVRG